MSTTDIQIRDVSMTYTGKNGEPISALQNINLDIREGEFISLLGPSGCGKTTLLRLVADLLQPTTGNISIRGQSPREIRLQQKFGIVFQNPVLYDWRTVRRNICLPMEIMKIPRKERTARINDVLELVGLQNFGYKYPFELSGGMQQRVGIARALALKPEILLMDEPFSALDEFTREKLNEDLLNIWSKNKKTIIFVTHNIAESVFLSDRVVVLSPHPGRLSAIVDIDLPRPRTSELREKPVFYEYVAKIRKCFEGV
ncbi:ABC transporter ATP-binding protein [Ethanoligenens harbinense]|uniref:ABC transporter related protein n=1 Tax=Ethanoligenens harbinense (strain DSM 18485 / JCM 12961 / CGMCC 1.5033 / YUAN-3) TaxID=663278 RepID=E6U510_ETHHY|nr:ABC transporter ATP-binding protein [Ethanoligenens harbinense]ADU26716.1 ABC transporter related protein [Ethanoligenens harbinense YUAN-3]AVQ97383.1 ABC transporter ATP-binding protein [Ethanoligenens harbinense YUAN-3]AYF40041.1 ABC transporter ATP-binding protein [Ethanoligenens harbinense]AYF42873.1 ABC transporter ATP-binding protein [Ethanoligenens harbinense]QCN93635.1 ABC transporter ATP-binding protein [Ethanoligenens harbinense]